MMKNKELAEEFHRVYERLAPQFGYETRPETKAFDPASNNGRLMIATVAEVMRIHTPELLEDFAGWLHKHGYIDSDYYAEEPKAIDQYIKEHYERT